MLSVGVDIEVDSELTGIPTLGSKCKRPIAL
jgi:hypothetical protein